MSRKRYSTNEISDRYKQAVQTYRAGWAYVDAMIHTVVNRSDMRNFGDAYTTVVLIDGVYRAQLNRTLGKGADASVAKALSLDWGSLNPMIQRLRKQPYLTPLVGDDIMIAHRALLDTINKATKGKTHPRDAVSFGTKFLHFQSEIVPIYDSMTTSAISRFTDTPSIRPLVKKYDAALSPVGTNQQRLRWYIVRVMALIEYLRMALEAQPVSVKLVDHMLWTTDA